ncbi:MAG: hypothetical protein HEQ17_01260 [Limnohabitans sp.]|jgi:hypothetical protein|uniref:hypothetical protein n=1 Tax=Limnohabitans sp. TaxID=1907725 RepID=UPI0025E0B6D8|nr:hypothetical protein [Limnohabitans sp.]MCO4087631.1 hypothetical protein [Limnohabitans sp.]
MIRVPRLKVNRMGVYCLRVVWTDEAGKRREASHSLRTKSPEIARVLALQFNEAYERKRSQRRMTTKKPEHLPNFEDFAAKFELDLSRGVMKSDGPEGGCPKFCVNGQMAGNCRTSRKMNHDRQQRIDRPAARWL